jgi:hypothetical protein
MGRQAFNVVDPKRLFNKLQRLWKEIEKSGKLA